MVEREDLTGEETTACGSPCFHIGMVVGIEPWLARQFSRVLGPTVFNEYLAEALLPYMSLRQSGRQITKPTLGSTFV